MKGLMQAIKLAAKSISTRKGRTLLTMLGIIIGLAAVITLVSYAQGETKQMMDYYESMGTNQIQVSAYKWGSSQESLFQSLYDYCLRLDNLVIGVTPNSTGWGTMKYGAKNSDSMDMRPQLYLGSDQWSLCNNFTIAKGRDLSYLDVEKYNQVCVIGSKAKELFFNYANPIGESISINGIPFTVIGVYEQKDFMDNQWWSMDNVVVVPYTANRVLSTAGMGMSMGDFVVKAKDKESTTEAITRLDGFLKGLIGTADGSGMMYGYYQVYSTDQYAESANEASLAQQRLLGGIAAISLLVGGIGIMNIMLVTVTERTREIGIRKAIGAERRSIIVQFLIEAAMICGIGGILGIALGYLGTLVICKMALNIILLPGPSITAAAFLVSVILGIIFGLYPAIKASGLQPVVALRAD